MSRVLGLEGGRNGTSDIEIDKASRVLLTEAETRVLAAWTAWNHAGTREAHDLAHTTVTEALHAWNSLREAVYDLGARVSASEEIMAIYVQWFPRRSTAHA